MEVHNSSSTTHIKVVKISFKWIIQNISWVHKMNVYNNLFSPLFPDGSNSQFNIRLSESDSENLKISLLWQTVGNFEHISEILIFLADQKKISFTANFDYNTKCIKHTIKWSDLFKNKNEFLPGNNLIINCNINLLGKPVNSKQFNEILLPQSKFVENLAGLLYKKDFHDVQIESSGGHKSSANKIILSARSKVFAAMFEHPTEENQENYIKISDFSREVIAEMLHFIYTDEAPNLEELAEDLIAAADKYGLERLKAMCASCLSKNLSVKNAALTFKLADLHNEEELRSESIKYIKTFLSEVVKTEGWTNLITMDKDLILSEI